MVKVRAFRTVENSIRRLGFNYVAGVDEVGRGCLAGPVVAAAVVLRREVSVGHGARAVSRTVGLAADQLAFLARHTGLAPREESSGSPG